MQQGVAALNAERADDQVDRFADRDTPSAQISIVSGSLDGEIGVAKRYDFKDLHGGFDLSRCDVRPDAAQDLAEDQISDQQVRPGHQRAKARDRVRDNLAKVINPNRAVDDNHLSSRFSSRSRMTSSQKSTLPASFKMSCWCWTRTNIRSAASTTARFVLRPVSFCASFSNPSLISTFVRIGAPWCINSGSYTHRRRGNANQPEHYSWRLERLARCGHADRCAPSPVGSGAAEASEPDRRAARRFLHGGRHRAAPELPARGLPPRCGRPQ